MSYQLSAVAHAQTVSETACYLTINSAFSPGDGVTKAPVFITINDSSGSPISGKQVTVLTFRGTGSTAVDQPSSLTDASGQCTAFIHSSVTGSDSVSAVCDGLAITRGVNRDGARGIWHFDNDCSDASGGGYNGVNSGGSWVSGRFGSALMYDGNTSYAYCDSSTIIDSAVTVGAWVYINNYPPSGTFDALIAGKKGAWWITVWSDSNSNIGVFWIQGMSAYVICGADPLPLNQWFHIAGTYKDGDIRAYLNGEPVGQDVPAGLLGDPGFPMQFSNSYSPAVDFSGALDGIVDEAVVYEKALTPEEIRDVYTGQCRITFTGSMNSLRYVSTPIASTCGDERILNLVATGMNSKCFEHG